MLETKITITQMDGKNFHRNRQFFVAVLLAAIYAMDTLTWREAMAAARMLFRSLTARRGKASQVLWFGHMKDCFKCPIFCRATLTCGSPLSTHGLGCNCFMPAKARLTEAACWANEHPEMNIVGWRKNGN